MTAAKMTLQQVDYMNARRDAKPASGGTTYASREQSRLAETSRQRDGAMSDGERSAAVAWQAVSDLQSELRVLRDQLAEVQAARHANGDDCQVCAARRATQAARVRAFRQRKKEGTQDGAIPY